MTGGGGGGGGELILGDRQASAGMLGKNNIISEHVLHLTAYVLLLLASQTEFESTPHFNFSDLLSNLDHCQLLQEDCFPLTPDKVV
jgi:hypothetical protein